MSEERAFPFGGVPVYNPQSLSKEEAIAQFHVRQSDFEHLMDLLRQEQPPQVLIIGSRGMGKTTLLQRVRYGVEDESELNRRYLVLVFPEEQYNVNQLHRFLLNTVDAVADAMERLQDTEAVSQIEAYADSLSKKRPEEVEEEAPQFLSKFSREVRRNFLLLVDNADRLFDMLDEQQQWRLRELLSSREDLTFFGATAQASEAVYDHGRAFFEFFQIQILPPLTAAEIRSLLLKLSDAVEEEESGKGTAKRRVNEWLEADVARLRTLVQLTGGNPRTTVLLFHLVLDGLRGGAREYLEQLLDQVTPTYKGRVDELSPQAQQVLDAVALHWDPVTAMEVASESGLETGAVSTQLTRLVRQGILEKADPGDSRKALYQVAERFFNIWYLMRASRRVRAKLRWFVEFLRVFFDNEELERIARDRIERYRPTWRENPTEVETAFAYVLASGMKRDRIEAYLRQNCLDTEQVWGPYLELMEGAPEGPAKPPDKKEGFTAEAEIRALIGRDPENAGHWVKLGNLLRRNPNRAAEAEAAFRNAIEVDPKSAKAWAGLGRLAQLAGRRDEAEALVRKAIEIEPSRGGCWGRLGDVLAESAGRWTEAEAAYRKAIELDPQWGEHWHHLGKLLGKTPERMADAEAAYRKAIELDPKQDRFWHSLARLLAKMPGRAAAAEAACRKAIEIDPEWAGYWHGLGNVLSDIPGRVAEAEAAYRKAIELDPQWHGSWRGLGSLLSEIPERAAEAEAAYRKGIELDPKGCEGWCYLGDLLAKTPERAAEAEMAYRKANELNRGCAGCWGNLARVLAENSERAAEAEGAFRKAIELDPQWAGFWQGLGNLLAKAPERAEEAEAAYRKAVELDPQRAGAWQGLGNLLARIPQKVAEAEAAYRKAIEIDPEWVGFWHGLGGLLAEAPGRAADAEAAYRKAIELDSKWAGSWYDLGSLLTETPERAAEAEAAYRKAITLDPESGIIWARLALFLACRARKPREAETAFRNAIRIRPNNAGVTRNLGVLLYCELGDAAGGLQYLARAHQIEAGDPVTTAIACAGTRGVGGADTSEFPVEAARKIEFWREELLLLVRNYPPFGKLLLGVCDLVEELDTGNPFVKLYRAVALAQLLDFPRASVAFDDALIGDPILLLSSGQQAIETILAAAVGSGRVRDFLEVLTKKEWKDAWRPIYEALRAVEAGSAEYLKRIAVEFRGPTLEILRRIAPNLRDVDKGMA